MPRTKMKLQPLLPSDRENPVGLPAALELRILAHVQDDFKPLRDLLGEVSKATLYRHVDRLLALGFLKRRGNEYGLSKSRVADLLRRNATSTAIRIVPEASQNPV